jgi:hypothetical protein
MSIHTTLEARIAPGISVVRETVTEQELEAVGVHLTTDFPGSTVEDFRKYPVLAEGGWYMAIKHQTTLQSVSRTPWNLFGPIPPLSDGLLDSL